MKKKQDLITKKLSKHTNNLRTASSNALAKITKKTRQCALFYLLLKLLSQFKHFFLLHFIEKVPGANIETSRLIARQKRTSGAWGKLTLD